VIGIATGFWDVIAVSYRQAAVPDRLLGRIMAAYRFVAYGAFSLGATLGGVIARIGGNRAPFLAGALVVGALIPYLMVALRSVELDPARVDS
jgi:MFS family permease